VLIVFGVLMIYAPFSAVHLSDRKQVEIPTHSSARAVARILRDHGVIHSQWGFLATTKLLGYSGDLQAGTYVFAGTLRLREVIRTISQGGGVSTDVTVTIPEGLRSDQIAKLLAQPRIVDTQQFMTLITQPTGAMRHWFEWLQSIPADQGLEGVLFGDTYRFQPQTPPDQVVYRFVENFQNKIIQRYFSNTPMDQFYTDLILASIIEMEVQTPEDRAMVADIFKKRLVAGIPLQADSTVNYITGKSMPRASANDILIASPYNTYRHRGLPPGPISNPSASSIAAVLHPTPNPYYYFLTDENGGVHYGKTMEEHQKNRKKYLK